MFRSACQLAAEKVVVRSNGQWHRRSRRARGCLASRRVCAVERAANRRQIRVLTGAAGVLFLLFSAPARTQGQDRPNPVRARLDASYLLKTLPAPEASPTAREIYKSAGRAKANLDTLASGRVALDPATTKSLVRKVDDLDRAVAGAAGGNVAESDLVTARQIERDTAVSLWVVSKQGLGGTVQLSGQQIGLVGASRVDDVMAGVRDQLSKRAVCSGDGECPAKQRCQSGRCLLQNAPTVEQFATVSQSLTASSNAFKLIISHDRELPPEVIRTLAAQVRTLDAIKGQGAKPLTLRQLMALNHVSVTTNAIGSRLDRLPIVKVTVRTRGAHSNAETGGFRVFAAMAGPFELAQDQDPQVVPAKATTRLAKDDVTQFDKISSPTNEQSLSVGDYYIWATALSGTSDPQFVSIGVTGDEQHRELEVVVPETAADGGAR